MDLSKKSETHLLIADRLSYLENQELQPVLELSDEIGRMLNTLMEKLNERKKKLGHQNN